MITEEQFLQPPKCNKCEGVKCNDSGWYAKRILTPEESEEYMTDIGLEVRKQCSWRNAVLSRKKSWAEHPQFEEVIKYYELKDYQVDKILDASKRDITQTSLDTAKVIMENIKEASGFLGIIGETNTGKSVLAHIISRAAIVEGLYPKLVSIVDLVEEMSNLKGGTIVQDSEGKVLYDLDEYANADLLVIDHFDLVNEFFKFADIRRTNLVLLFKKRLKNNLPTIILSCKNIGEVFTGANLNGAPQDLPLFINKNYTRLELYGKFERRKIKKDEAQEGQSSAKRKVKVRK